MVHRRAARERAQRGEGEGRLIVTTTGPGSLGDEAMIIGLASTLQASGEGPVHLFVRGARGRWSPLPAIDEIVDTGPPDSAWWLQLPALLSRYRGVDLIGADCLDGNYTAAASVRLIEIVNVAARAGVPANIIGFSFREAVQPEVIRAFQELPDSVRICVRDEPSRQRFEAQTGRSAHLTADSAFLLPPDDLATGEGRRLAAWCDERHGSGRTVLSVNFNRQVVKGGDEKSPARLALFESYVKALGDLLEQRDDVDLLLIPHDYRGAWSDLHAASDIRERLSARGHAARMELPGEPLTAQVVKGLMGHVDATLSARMHLAIASLGRGTPIGCVTYHGKFEGLFMHFGLTPRTLSPDDASDPDRLLAMITGLLTEAEGDREQVGRAWDNVRSMAASNLVVPGAAPGRPQVAQSPAA